MSNSKISIGKIIGVAIVTVWLSVIGVFLWRNYGPSRRVAPVDASNLKLEEEWFNLIYKGQKVGWVHNDYKPLGGGGWTFESNSLMKLTVIGSSQEAKVNIVAEMDPGFNLRKFEMEFSSGIQNMYVDGDIIGNELTYRIRSAKGANAVEKKVTLKEPPALMDMVGRVASQRGLKVGAKFTVPVFDPITQGNNSAVAEVIGKERIKAASKEWDTFVVKITYMGMEMTEWVDAEGRSIKSDTPMGFSAVLATKEEAMSLDGAGKIDVVAASAVPVNKFISEPRDVKYLKVKLEGVKDLSGLALDGGDQSFNDSVLEVKISGIGQGYALPDTGADRQAERSPEPLIQSDNPQIVSAAKSAIGDASNAIEAGRRINQWVYENLEKKGTLSIPSALDVLKTRKGDCNEHTQLFVAMARAVGLPARVAVGVVYLQGAFYYHAWPEIWLGDDSGWIPIDPTFGQFPADATHLRFSVGSLDKQSEIVRFVGQLKIEVIENR